METVEGITFYDIVARGHMFSVKFTRNCVNTEKRIVPSERMRTRVFGKGDAQGEAPDSGTVNPKTPPLYIPLDVFKTFYIVSAQI